MTDNKRYLLIFLCGVGVGVFVATLVGPTHPHHPAAAMLITWVLGAALAPWSEALAERRESAKEGQ